MTLACPVDGCLSLHPHGHSLAMHLFKTESEDHAEWDDLDDAQREVYRRDDLELDVGAVDDGPEPTVADGDEPTVDDGPEPSPDGDAGEYESPDANRDEPSPTGADPAPEVADAPGVDVPVDTEAGPATTDGGRAPPVRETTPDDDGGDDEIPDRLVPVDDFVANAEDELTDERVESDEWATFVESITSGSDDYVDVDASDLEAGEVVTVDG